MEFAGQKGWVSWFRISPSGAPNGKSGEKTGTVWDQIEGTQPNYPDSPIPRSFNIDTTSGHRFWVHGNATEHFFEHFTGSLKRSCLDKARIATQVHLKSFEAALDKLAKQGYEFDKLYLVDGWEIKIGQRSVVSTDKNPQVYHARYIGE